MSVILLVGFCPVFALSSSATTVIKDINITGIEIPRPGVSPDYTAVYENGYTSTSKFDNAETKQGITWRYDVNKTTTKTLKPSDTFSEAINYTVAIVITAKAGYEFQVDGESPRVHCKVNGNNARVSGITDENNKNTLVVTYTFSACEYFSIETIKINDLKIPSAGDTPDITASVALDRYRINGDIQWYNETKRKVMTLTDVFEQNCTYTVTIWIRANNGCKLKTDKNDLPDFTAKINGEPAEVIITETSGGKSAGITITYTVSSLVSKVSVIGINLPTAGQTPDFTCESIGNGYKVSEMGIDWENSKGRTLDANETFETGKEYTVKIRIKTLDGFAFSVNSYNETDINATINEKYEANVFGDCDVCYVSYTFTVPEDITTVTITDITAPEAGVVPDTTGTVSGTGYEITKIEWVDTTGEYKDYIYNITSFEEGRKYTVQITLNTVDNYRFHVDGDYQNITGTINESKAIIYNSNKHNEVIVGLEFTIAENIPTELLIKEDSSFTVDNIKKTVFIPIDATVEFILSKIKNEYFAVLTSDKKTTEKTDLAGTGMIIQILDKSSKVLSEYTVIVMYDVDGNGKIQAADARLALRASVELENLEGVYKIAADTDNNTNIKAADARAILRKSVGLD